MKIAFRIIAGLLLLSMMLIPLSACQAPQEDTERSTTAPRDPNKLPNDGAKNVYVFNDENNQVTLELCTSRMIRVQYSQNGDDGYRPADPEYYMVQKEAWDLVEHSYENTADGMRIRTADMELVVKTAPFRLSVYDLEGNLLSRDSAAGMYERDGIVGVKKQEGVKNAGGIFGFGSGDHGRRADLNRYDEDFDEFTMSHGRVVAPFFMSTVGYGIFLNTISENTKFFKRGGGFETEGYLDYFFMYGPDFKTILNEYAELTGRMELYGKWAHGFMLSKYGNDNATQAEFLEWLHKLRDEGYPCDCYVFDYGWRGDVNVTQSNHGAGQKWGNQMWSNDTKKFPDIAAMFEEARALGFHVGLHNNAGTPEASGGDKLYLTENQEKWVKSYMDSVITTGYGDWFWPDEFDVLGSNSAPVLSALGAYEAWKEYTVESRPMFMTRGSFAGQHFATAWSGDTDASERDLAYQIGFALDTGLIGYWATSCDLGGFKTRPTDALYTRWVSEFGAWSAIMRTHGHDGREPWTYDETAQETLKENLAVRYSLYPYIYTSAWQGYRYGTPIMRAMILEDGSQSNPDAWDLNKQYYFGDWFLVAPATEARDTTVSVWFPPNTTWYNYYTGERYEGGENGLTVTLAVALDEIPVFVKGGAIVPMGPDVNYADEFPLSPLTLDIYPKGTSTYTLYEDDGESRRYITENAYATTTYTCEQVDGKITFTIGARFEGNSAVYSPVERSYDLVFHHVGALSGVTLDGKTLSVYSSRTAFDAAEKGAYADGTTVYVKFPDTAKKTVVVIEGAVLSEPALGSTDETLPDMESVKITDGTLFELENAELLSANESVPLYVGTEWKGYTGTGFVKAFKTTGDAILFSGEVTEGGRYDLTVRVGCGKKGSSKYDDTDRLGALYVDGKKVADLSFAVTEVWGDDDGNGVWLTYTVSGVELSAGVHSFKLVAEGTKNAGNYNLDSMLFTKTPATNGFDRVAASSADRVKDFTEVDGVLVTEWSGAYLGWSSLMADGKQKFTIRVKSTTGGTLTVFETGVGDKILCTVELPSDGEWLEITVDCRDTDADPSPIYLSFAADGDAFDAQVDWFKFE
ncbi:MAG: DUF4968 domain-containing protein [Clostridia bacterium]|nr:DUF4968 domain-containing protein [Clostridia bacterium]